MSEELLSKMRKDERFFQVPPEELGSIAELTAKLRPIQLFQSVPDLDLAHIAQAGKWQSCERGDLLIHQGARERIMYVILKGQLRVWSEDEYGRTRLLNYAGAGDFCGELVFLGGETRVANVDVMDDAEVVAFGDEGWQRMMEHRSVRNHVRYWGPERARRSGAPFQGKQWDEVTVVRARKSFLALAQMILFPVAVLFFTYVIAGLVYAFARPQPEILISVALAITVGMGLWIFWMWQDWRNDDFIVTTKRVIHIERVLIPPFPIERHEAAIEQVTDAVTSNQGLWTMLFDVYTLEIRTSGAGTIRFPYVKNADDIRDRIFAARDLARVRRAGEDQTRIREKLYRQFGREVKPITELDTGEQIGLTPERKGLMGLLDYFVPRTRIVREDQIIWRQHLLILLGKVLPPICLFVVSVFLLILVVASRGILAQLPPVLTIVPVGLLLAGAIGWYLWQYDGWRNDLYIVTDSRIIDIEGSPFHLRGETRAEGEFSIIQNITYSSPNWFYRVLRIGDVYADTAAEQRAYTFDLVGRPDEVQQEIFRRLVNYREAGERAATERRYDEFAKWFETYDRWVVHKEE